MMNGEADLGRERGPVKNLPGSAKPPIRVNFLLTTVAAWFASPLGVLFLHWQGYGANPYLVTLLIALSLGAPFQLLLNEYLAAGIVRHQTVPSALQMASIAGVQLVTVLLGSGLYGSGMAQISPVERGILGLSVTVANLLSFHAAAEYYRLTIADRASRRLSLTIGAIPGLTMLAISIAAGMLQEPRVLLMGAMLPAVTQWLYLFRKPRSNSSVGEYMTPNSSSMITTYGLLLVLSGASLAGSFIRTNIAELDTKYAAILIVGLNLFGTTAMVFSRSSYLLASSGGYRLQILAGSAVFGLSALVAMQFYTAGLLGMFLAVQLFTIGAISFARYRAHPTR